MTNLRKCHSISMFAVIALAFVCLVVGQATVAKVEKASINENADNSFETSVPLPTLHRGMAGSSLSTGDPVTEGVINEGALIDPRKVANSNPPIADGVTKAQGDDYTDAFIIGDETALPFTGTGDVSTGTNAGEPGFCLYGLDLCLNGYSCAPDQWWQFTPTADMRINATLANGTYDGDDDWAMMLTDGDAVTYVTCSDPAAGTMPAFVNVQLTGGHTYYIMVEALWSIGASAGLYQLDVEEYVPHPDFCTPKCAVATDHEVELCGERINGGCYGNYPDLTQSVTTRQAITGDPTAAIICGTLDVNPWITGTGTNPRSGIERDADQWSFSLTEVTNLTVTVGAEIETRFFMHGAPDANCANQSFFGSLTILQGQEVSASFILNPGDYVFSLRGNTQIMGCGEGDYGDPRYYIETGFIPLVAFDDCPLATEITGEAGSPYIADLCPLTGDGVSGYWNGAGLPAGGSYLGDFGMPQNGWWLWTCDESGEYTFSTCNSPDIFGTDAQDQYIAVWDASVGCYAGSGAQLAFDDDSPNCLTNWNSEVTFIAAAGLQYYITVGSWYDDGVYCDEVWLDVSHVPIPLIADVCLDGPIQLTEDKFNAFFNNLNATEDGPEPSTCNTGSFGGDIWFEVTAWETGYAYASFCDVNFDANMEIYAGADCPSNANPKVPIRCNDDGCSQDTNPWPQQHGSYASFPVVMGEHYILRVGGWYNPPDNPLTVGGMGFGWYEFFIVADPSTVSPENDFCVNETPVALADGVADERTGNTFYATRNDLDCNTTLFGPAIENNVWEGFSVPSGVCMDVAADFFGTVDPHQANGSRYAADPGEAIAWTGCPCEGTFVGVASTIGCLQPNECVVTGGDFNNYHAWEMMPAGDYWWALNHNNAGTMGYQFDYVIHFTGTVITCEYCVAGANTGSCGVSGGSWIAAVRLQEINNSATGCHGYEDRTAETASLYKGFSYTLAFDMGKIGLPSYTYDRAYVWIDWNQNSVFFDGGESYIPTRLAYEWTMPFTVPLDAIDPGAGASMETRMRIRLGSTGNTGNAYCGTVTFGEVEDYVILAVDLECGDFDMSGTLDADDIAFLQAWYFGGGTAPDYWQRADIDGDGMVTLADLIALVDAAYHGGATNCM